MIKLMIIHARKENLSECVRSLNKIRLKLKFLEIIISLSLYWKRGNRFYIKIDN